MKISIVIPARFASTRLPRKLLLDLAGHPVLYHTWKRASSIHGIDEVLILADYEEVADVAQKFGATVWMTDPQCSSGTERIASVADRFAGDFIINVQGDEPFIDTQLLAAIANDARKGNGDIITAAYRISELSELENPNRVKVVLGHQREALYFSRNPIPFVRDVEKKYWLQYSTFWGHIGVYGYSKSFLQDLPHLPPGILSETEKLEQLQFLEAGKRIHVLEASKPTLGIDTAEDMERARKLLSPS
ncbi:MAG: 3-deoxy-manno-octulosonate cytidylyltransferase [Puniceicoccales bacterium]|jgi:3-deoxy-manno-octulosonate cytidylyltransferase (CMP-KDO synthetase)|nr:3-deoxy-manno-octulosonate cytidylyltransferase [Puniceicoccales bacterium]